MSNKLYEENDIQNIANAIRAKNGSTDKYTVSQMSDAVLKISGGTRSLNVQVIEPIHFSATVEVTVEEI